MILANAKTKFEIARKIPPKCANAVLNFDSKESLQAAFSNPKVKAEMTVSAAEKFSLSTPVQSITRAVSVHKSTVSMNTSSAAQKPIITGSLHSDEVCAKVEVPIPASFENSPLRTPTEIVLAREKPKIPPEICFIPKADAIISVKIFVILLPYNRIISVDPTM